MKPRKPPAGSRRTPNHSRSTAAENRPRRRRPNLVRVVRGILAAGLLLALALLSIVLSAHLYFSLPDREGIATSIALPAPKHGRLTSALRAGVSNHPGESGVVLLAQGSEAFAVRAQLADFAERSIDVQYYIWRKDLTGLLLLEALESAANRGVRVRLLLDDNGVYGLDSLLVDLDAHPNINIRFFNPLVLRTPKFLNFAFDFVRLNRRMHNKSFTVDNTVSVVGGRNIGDEYFGTGPNPLYVDLDVLAAGAIVPAVSADFDRYWNSQSAYPAGRILDRTADGQATVAAAISRIGATAETETYQRIRSSAGLVHELLDDELDLEWAQVDLVSDPPSKIVGEAHRDQLLFTQLVDRLGQPSSRLDLVSPYFVPGEQGSATLKLMAGRGVDVRVFTNSFSATDVLPVHAGYIKYRKPLLRSGVGLYEMKSSATPDDPRREHSAVGSSGTSLHAKLFTVDGERTFVGSFNFDPRSVLLNTEMGFVIHSAQLSQSVHERLSREGIQSAYQPTLEGDALIWRELTANRLTIHAVEPGSNWSQRASMKVIGWLPVQWLL